jgi:hypothetical protein
MRDLARRVKGRCFGPYARQSRVCRRGVAFDRLPNSNRRSLTARVSYLPTHRDSSVSLAMVILFFGVSRVCPAISVCGHGGLRGLPPAESRGALAAPSRDDARVDARCQGDPLQAHFFPAPEVQIRRGPGPVTTAPADQIPQVCGGVSAPPMAALV